MEIYAQDKTHGAFSSVDFHITLRQTISIYMLHK